MAASAEAANDIFSNVLLNAIEAVGNGGIVCVELQPDTLICTVMVEDDGPGIRPRSKKKLSNPFSPPKHGERAWAWPLLRAAWKN